MCLILFLCNCSAALQAQSKEPPLKLATTGNIHEVGLNTSLNICIFCKRNVQTLAQYAYLFQRTAK